MSCLGAPALHLVQTLAQDGRRQRTRGFPAKCITARCSFGGVSKAECAIGSAQIWSAPVQLFSVHMESGTLFGPNFRKRLSIASYPKIDDEENCLLELQKLVGQHANPGVLVRQLRQTLGRLHWAVNGYFREMLALPVPERGREDFAPGALMVTMPDSEDCLLRPRLRPASNKRCAATSDFGPCDPGMMLPLNALEDIFSIAGVRTVCAASFVCRYFHQAAKSNLVWQRLYKARWGGYTPAPLPEAEVEEEAPALVPLPNQLDSFFSIHAPIGLMMGGLVRGSLPAAVPAPRRRPRRESAAGEPSSSARGADERAETVGKRVGGAADQEGGHLAASGDQSEERGGLGGGGPACDQSDLTDRTREQPQMSEADGPGGNLAENVARCNGRASTSGQQNPVCWRSAYIQHHIAEQKMRCPCCERGVVAPVLYGFPSDELIEGMRAGRLILGGDYMMPTLPLWGCSYCTARFDVFPFPPYPT